MTTKSSLRAWALFVGALLTGSAGAAIWFSAAWHGPHTTNADLAAGERAAPASLTGPPPGLQGRPPAAESPTPPQLRPLRLQVRLAPELAAEPVEELRISCRVLRGESVVAAIETALRGVGVLTVELPGTATLRLGELRESTLHVGPGSGSFFFTPALLDLAKCPDDRVVGPIDLSLRPGTPVQGRVLLDSGAPAVGAPVTLAGNELVSTSTDALGGFHAVVPRSESVTARVVGSPWGVGFSPPMRCTASDMVVFPDIQLFGKGAIQGVVTRADGSPSRGAVVVVWDAAIDDPESAEYSSSNPTAGLTVGRGTSDADGRFRIAGLRSASFRVALADTGGGFISEPTTIMSTDSGVTVPELVLSDPRHFLRVLALYPNGSPAVGARLTVQRMANELWAHEGTYRGTDLPGGRLIEIDAHSRYRVIAEIHGIARASLTIRPSVEVEVPAILVLQAVSDAPGRLEVRAEAEDGLPVGHFIVRVFTTSDDLVHEVVSGDGVTASLEVAPGDYGLSIQIGTDAPAVATRQIAPAFATVMVSDSAPTRASLVLPTGASLFVTSTLAPTIREASLTYAWVRVVDVQGHVVAMWDLEADYRVASRVTEPGDSSGRFELSATLPPGGHVCEALRRDGGRREYAVHVTQRSRVTLGIE